MVEEQSFDQSDFSVSQTVLQAPPVPINSMPETRKKRRWPFVVMVAFILLLVVMVMVNPRKNEVQNTLESTPEPTPVITVSQMQQMINQVTTEVKQADLENVLLPQPQVDMEVEF